MSRTHAKADIYIDDSLRWELAILVEQPSVDRLLIKTRNPDHPSSWVNTAILAEAVYVGKSNGATRWTGLLDGEPVTLTLVPRRNAGCSSCGR